MATKAWYAANREVMRQHRREWYAKNQAKQFELVNKRRKRLKKWLKELKSTLKCEKCGENHPGCLDFHHDDPNEKEISLSQAVAKKGWCEERMLEEIAKCTVLCSNCHRKLHWKD